MTTLRDLDRSTRPLSPDERDEIAAAATTAERSNRPSALVVLAGILFVIACSALGVAATRQASAQAEVDRRLAELDTLRDRVIDLRVAENRPPDVVLPAPGNFLSRIEEKAREAGIEGDLGFSSRNEDIGDGVSLVSASYDFRIERLSKAFNWIGLVAESVQGVQVRSVSLDPQSRGARKNWVFKITFQRYERAG